MSTTQPCPLCQMTIASGDDLQLHYLTSCSGYDKVGDQPRPKLEETAPIAGGEGVTSAVGSEGVASNALTVGAGGVASVGTPMTGSGGGASVASASATAQPPDDGIVQFMWQPLTEMSYPKVTLLASFKPGSVDLSLDVDGGHYASEHVTIPKGMYEGQLVVGDSFVHPVKEFTIDRDGIVVIQFESSHKREDAHYDQGNYGAGYMQTNPSYNIDIGGGVQDNYSQYGGYGTGGGSSSGQYRNRTGGGYDAESRHTSGGLQRTDDFSNYQSYDNSGHEHRTSPVNQPPPNLSNIGRTQEAATQGTHSDKYSCQLSSEGFTPEPVKSKTRASSTFIPDNARPTPSTLVTGYGTSHHTTTSRASTAPLPSQSMAHAGQRSTDARPQTVNIAETATSPGSQNIRNNLGPPPVSAGGDDGGGFNVGQLQQEKQDMAVDYERQLLELKEQLEAMTGERDDLKHNQERVKAHLEGKVRRLEKQLQKAGSGEQPAREHDDDSMARAQLESAQETVSQLQGELDALKRQRNVGSHVGRETSSRDLEKELSEVKKELNEVKNENAAMQSQLVEYAGVISDQSKVIQSGKVHDSEYVRLQQHNIHLAEFLKKQQLEYEEAISSLKKKISHTAKFVDENLKIHQLNVNLTAELEDYRTQTKRLLADLQQKDATLAEKEAEVDQLRQQGAYHSSSSSDRDKMELDMLRQKCDAWREEVEKLAPLRDEVGRLHAHASELEEQIKFLKADNEGLGKQLQSVVEESDRNRTEAYRKAPPDYDNLRDRFTELQQVRVQLENELLPLREERAAILLENTHLREGTQPERYAKLKEDHVALEDHYRQVQIALEEEKAAVLKLQQQLSEATSSGSDKLLTIRDRMERYRQEREAAKSQTEELQWQLQSATEELQRVRETSESNTERLHNQLSQYDQEVSSLATKAQDRESRLRRYREERNQAQVANQAFQDEISTLNQTVQELRDELQSKDQYLNSRENRVPRIDSTDYSSHTQNRGASMSPYHYNETTSPPRDQPPYSPDKYASSDDQFREDMVSPTVRSTSSQRGDSRTFQGRSQSVSSSTSSLASSRRESGKPKSQRHSSGQLAEVRTKEGTITTYIQKPIVPLSAKDKDHVIIKCSEGDFEMGTLMYIGMINQKEMAGVHLDIRMPRSSIPGLTYPKSSDGTCEADGRRYFKCPLGYGVYVHLSKIYVEEHMESFTV